MALSYYYDAQCRRYVEQVQRVFSHFQILVGIDTYGNEQFYRVPCVYGDPSRMAAHILRNNSENTTLPVPFIAIYDADLEMAPDRRQNPTHVDKRQVIEREFDRNTNEYSEQDGYRYTVERYMPIPYNMTFNVDVWYTQTDHKLQICEQIMMLFNPDINIQTSINALDWTGLTTLDMTGMTWNSRGVPIGIDDGMRITTFNFNVPIWINPPAKVKQQKIIHQIITDLYTATLEDKLCAGNNSLEGIPTTSPENLLEIFSSSNFASRLVITPGNHYIEVIDGEIKLLGQDQSEINFDTGLPYKWRDLIEQYDAQLVDNISLLRLRPISDLEVVDFDFIGRISYHPTDDNRLIWTADLETIPADTLTVVDAIIDPDRNIPGADLNSGGLPIAANNQRYIIGANDIRPLAQGDIWSNIDADLNDIIEFNGGVWSVSFDASAATGDEHTTNSFTGKKLKFDFALQDWIIIPDGVWKPGFWRLALGE